MRRALLLLCLAAPAHADDYHPPDFMTALPPLPARVDPGTAWRLDLAEALRIAMHQNLGIVVERDAVEIAHLGVAVAGGQFEPLLTGGYTHLSSATPPPVLQAGMAGSILTLTNDHWQLSLSDRLQTGLKLEADFISDRSKSTAGTAVEPLLYNSQVVLSATQPLLRGFSTDLVIPRIDILRAELASEREREQLAITAANVVEQTEDAYWDVVQALYSYDLQVRSQQRAVDQLELTKRQIAAGLMPPSDVVAAESTLAQRDLALVNGEQQVDAAWDRLRAMLNLPRDQWTRPILPVDMPTFAAGHPSAEQALDIAIKNRPELAQFEIDLKSQELSVRKADNDKLPEIDLSLSGGLLGQDSTYGGSLVQVGSTQATTYTIGLNLIWTPLRRATTAAAEIERARQRIAIVNRDKAVQDTWAAVRDAVRNLASAERGVYAAAKFRELATQNLDLEQRRFLASQSSQLFVAQRQEELATAQFSELSAVLAHKKATAALLHATGQLLTERGVQLTLRAAPR
jgi:outer membrane protein TolC